LTSWTTTSLSRTQLKHIWTSPNSYSAFM